MLVRLQAVLLRYRLRCDNCRCLIDPSHEVQRLFFRFCSFPCAEQYAGKWQW